jgi:hypothetical protein
MATEGNASTFPPAWWGWEAYRQFAESVKTNLRYVRYRAADDFLAEVLATCGTRRLTIPEGTVYWRARRGCEYEQITVDRDDDISVCWDKPRPYGRDGMKPVSNWQSEGRANPRGIPYL